MTRSMLIPCIAVSLMSGCGSTQPDDASDQISALRADISRTEKRIADLEVRLAPEQLEGLRSQMSSLMDQVERLERAFDPDMARYNPAASDGSPATPPLLNQPMEERRYPTRSVECTLNDSIAIRVAALESTQKLTRVYIQITSSTKSSLPLPSQAWLIVTDAIGRYQQTGADQSHIVSRQREVIQAENKSEEPADFWQIKMPRSPVAAKQDRAGTSRCFQSGSCLELHEGSEILTYLEFSPVPASVKANARKFQLEWPGCKALHFYPFIESST